jgi:hypothetical protein
VANSEAQPPSHGLDRDDQQRAAAADQSDRAQNIYQTFKGKFGCVPHGVANPATAQKCTMIDATFGRLVLAAQPESSS